MPYHRKHSKPADESRMPYFPWQLLDHPDQFNQLKRLASQQRKKIKRHDFSESHHWSKKQSTLSHSIKKINGRYLARIPKLILGETDKAKVLLGFDIENNEWVVLKRELVDE